jgi:hypothetical protein
VLVVFAIAAAPASAQQKLCTGQGKTAPPTAAEKEQADLEYYAQRRAELGFRHDIAYIKELIARGVWEYDVGDIPGTPAENRYLRLRDKLNLGPRASRYPDPRCASAQSAPGRGRLLHEPLRPARARERDRRSLRVRGVLLAARAQPAALTRRVPPAPEV